MAYDKNKYGAGSWIFLAVILFLAAVVIFVL